MAKFTIESYLRSAGRCFGCCQENCRSCNCSCHSDEVVSYRVKYKNKILEFGFSDERQAQYYIDNQLNIRVVKRRFAYKKYEIREKMKEILKEEKETIKTLKSFK